MLIMYIKDKKLN